MMSRSLYGTDRYPVSGKTKWTSLLFIFGLTVMGGCGEAPAPAVSPANDQMALPFTGEPFDFLAADVDQDGRIDLTVVDHVSNQGKTFFQIQSRVFWEGPNFDEIGFHPGNLIIWPNRANTYIMSAEGGNSIVTLEPKTAEEESIFSAKKVPQRGGFMIKSVLNDRAPRYASLFHWPDWGASLAITPYDKSGIVLLKNYDPVKGAAEARIIVWLSEQKRSVRHANRVNVADLDGDGLEELIYATNITEEVWMIRYDKDPATIRPELLYRSDNEGELGMPNEAHPLDMDDDGDMDLLVADETNPGKIHVLLNDGKAHFIHGDALPFPTNDAPQVDGVIELSTGRDQDGRKYILASGHEAIAIYQVPDHWQTGQLIPVRYINKLRDNTQTQLMQDIDGDGWLDAVTGIRKGGYSVWIGYGPLWEHFEQWRSAGFVLGQSNKEDNQ